MGGWAQNSPRCQKLEFDPFSLKARLRVKTQQALYDKASGQRLLDDTLVLRGGEFGRTPVDQATTAATTIRKATRGGRPAAA
jgi:hypothetical protein